MSAKFGITATLLLFIVVGSPAIGFSLSPIDVGFDIGASNAAAASPQEAPVEEERYASGALKSTVRVNKEGKKFGAYTEYYESGKVRVRGNYRVGMKDGKFEHFFESQKKEGERIWKDDLLLSLKRWDESGNLIHELSRKKDRLFFRDPETGREFDPWPRSQKDIRTKIAQIDPPAKRFDGEKYVRPAKLEIPHFPGQLTPAYVEDAARYAGVYRWLCGLEPDLQIDPALNETSQCASLLFKLNGKLTHEPDPPTGMTDFPLYEKGKKGAKDSNICMGDETLRKSIDGYMDDSDDRNIDHVGHRRWILNWKLKKVGFGMVDIWSAMNISDESRTGKAPPWVAYPSPGYFPLEYMAGPHVAWSLMWEEARPRVLGGPTPTAEIWRLDDDFDLLSKVTLKSTFDATSIGGVAVIFRPDWDGDTPEEGMRLLVRVRGTILPQGAPPVVYMVEFFKATETPAAK